VREKRDDLSERTNLMETERKMGERTGKKGKKEKVKGPSY